MSLCEPLARRSPGSAPVIYTSFLPRLTPVFVPEFTIRIRALLLRLRLGNEKIPNNFQPAKRERDEDTEELIDLGDSEGKSLTVKLFINTDRFRLWRYDGRRG